MNMGVLFINLLWKFGAYFALMEIRFQGCCQHPLTQVAPQVVIIARVSYPDMTD